MEKKFETLKADYESLAALKGGEYERDAESFILDVICVGCDLNMIGTLLIGNVEGDIESVYLDNGVVMIHFSSRLMEGDIIFTSLQEESQRVVVDAVWNEVVANMGMKRVRIQANPYASIIGTMLVPSDITGKELKEYISEHWDDFDAEAESMDYNGTDFDLI